MESGQSSSVRVVRLVALTALALAVVGLVAILLRSGDAYWVEADFVNASQLVEGNQVFVAGQPVGSVDDIRLTDDGQARVRLTIEQQEFAPLRRGTFATVRQLSLSGQANRYVDLQLGPGGAPTIAEGGSIGVQDTEAAVDIDQLFAIFDPVARVAVSGSIELFDEFNAGATEEANEALRYLNPALASSAALFSEINRDRSALERFIVEDAELVTTTASRDEALSSLVENLSTTMAALSAERDELGEAVERLPAFLRRANSTFVNLRGALDDLDPLVEEAKPVVGNDLIPLFDQLRPFAADAAPTVRDLSRAISTPGEDNDLIDLLERQPEVAEIAVESGQRNGEERPGAFEALASGAEGVTPQLGFLRPYSPELVGWFDDFSASGAGDAYGGFSRAGLNFNAFTLNPVTGGPAELLPVPPELRDDLLGASVRVATNHRCPGALERGGIFLPEPGFNCNPALRPIGP
ncbi:MAG TPA: MlaD family protein [Solirubrobacteraceae bacterium]|nr:MlaD family protein [Solirubrobacteraceae bacterium]